MKMLKTPMKTKFVSKVICFQETLEYQNQFPYVMDSNRLYTCFIKCQ
jgi:hypothetical protein